MNNREPLIRPLTPGAVDVVGDVHGEIAALRALMKRLGYDRDGRHPEGRRLIFVGDLTDRGPDSPAVVGLVRDLIAAGRAQCVLGNHDLNLLLNHPKHDNRWFYGEPFQVDGETIPQAFTTYDGRCDMLSFLATLPVGLEREDLRVVHACWDEEMIALARRSYNVLSLYYSHFERIEGEAADRDDLDDVDRELLHQNQNPVKKITSGPEERTEQPIRDASGKLRNERRVPWWNDYRATFCVFGHYSLPAEDARGTDHAFCVDYGVGKRWTERRKGVCSGFSRQLAALRWPERDVVFDEV